MNKVDTYNTKANYDTNKLEYKQYYNQCYLNDPNGYVVCEEYTYGFV